MCNESSLIQAKSEDIILLENVFLDAERPSIIEVVFSGRNDDIGMGRITNPRKRFARGKRLYFLESVFRMEVPDGNYSSVARTVRLRCAIRFRSE